MKAKETYWSPLDNAAKIFPAISSKEHSAVMRLTVSLTAPLSIKYLFKAIEIASERFSYFKVRLRKGFFWYYLEYVDEKVVPLPDDNLPCRMFGMKKGSKLLFRILVYKNKLSVEASHILTDGYGVLNFLKAILLFYFREKGEIVNNQIDDFFISKADTEEAEDAFNRYFKENIPNVVRQSKAFHLPYRLSNKPRFDTLSAILSINELKQKAKNKGVSITEYLVAAYLLVLQDIFFEGSEKGISTPSKIARVQVPVNLRNIYPTKTMRNFSLFIMPEIDFRLGKYTFDEILKIVFHKIRLETDEKLISKIISRNVGGEKKLFVRGFPIWLKSLILYFKYYSEGTNQYSGVVTNLGKVELPGQIINKVEYFAFTPPPPNPKLKINCGVIGYENNLVLSFGNISRSKQFEQKYLHFLSMQGIPVKIENMY